MTGTLSLTRVALRRDRDQLLLWALGVLAFAVVCAGHVTSGFGDEAQRIASLEIAIDSPALLVGRGLPMGTSEGAFLFYTYGATLATIFAMFGVLFAVRHGRSEEDDGTRELLRAGVTGRLASLVAVLIAGTIATLGLAASMVVGLALGGIEPRGSVWAGLGWAAVGVVFVAVGALCGQLAPTARAASGLGTAVVLVLFVVRVAADLQAEIDPETFVGAPVLLAWLSPFSLVGLADPYGGVDPGPLLLMAAGAVLGAVAAVVVERRREFGDSIVAPRPGRADASPTLRTPLRVTLRLQRGTLAAMMLAGLGVGAFAATLAVLAISGSEQNDAVVDTIRAILAVDGPLYDTLLSYVMVLVGEAAAVAGVLVVLRARGEETAGNVELMRGTAVGPVRWFAGVLGVGALSIVLVLATSWIGAAVVYLGQGESVEAIWDVLGATAAQLPATTLYLGVVALVFATAPRLTGAVAWTMLALGIVLAELGGRLGLPAEVIAVSPFVHTPLVTTANPDWGGAIWMTAVALVAAGLAVVAYRRRDLSP